MHGNFNCNRMLLAPMGCPVQVHVKSKDRKTFDFHTEPGFYLFTSSDHYRVHNNVMTKTKAERLSDAVVFQHNKIGPPKPTNATLVIKALASFLESIKGVTKGFRKAALKNSVNMKDIERLAELTSSMTSKLPEVADDPVQVPSRLTQPTESIDEVVERPNIARDELRRSSRLAGHQAPKAPIQMPQAAQRDVARDKIARAIRQAAQRVPPSTTNGQPSQRVPSNAADKQPSPRVASTARRQQLPQSTTTQSVQPVASRTRGAQTKAAAAEAGPARRTRSQTGNILERALHAACFIDNKSGSAKRLAYKRYPKAMFSAALAVMDIESGKMLKHRQLINHPDPDTNQTWRTSTANEIGRLFQGVGGRIKNPTNTCHFVKKDQVPAERFKDVTYAKFECTERPQKAKKHRTRAVLGGNRIHFPGDTGTPTAEMLLVKIMLNSVISTPGARFMSIDIKNFYLATPMKRYEYIKLKLATLPDEIIQEYKLKDIATPDGAVYVEVRKGMYGLPQAGILANELLEKRLNKHGYFQSPQIPGLWTHVSRPISFTLVVDDFGVKYVGEEHVHHLMGVLTDKKQYEITADWKGKKYIGITLDWDYERHRVHLSMPGYIKAALQQFGHLMQMN